MMSHEPEGDDGETTEGKSTSLPNLDRPTLNECINFRGKCGTINIPQQIGTKYITFGIALLGVPIVNRLVREHGNDAEKINKEILKQWFSGTVKKPVTWKILIAVLRSLGDVSLDSLADEIEAVKSGHWGERTFKTRHLLMSAAIASALTAILIVYFYKPAEGTYLSLPMLRYFPTERGIIDIASKIGTEYERFGILLLEDAPGSKVETIEKKMHGDPLEVTVEILQQWLQGNGRSPVTWQTLIECLETTNFNVLADEIKGVLSRQQPTRRHHYPVPKQSLRNLKVIEKGKQPSLSELLHIVIPGPKDVNLIQTVATKWKKLALELGFELSVVDSIGSRYSDSEEDCKSMLRKWLMHQDATVSWEVLMTALDNIGFSTVTQDLVKATGNYWISGANVVGLATASIKRSTELEWKEFGFALNVTLAESDMCNITIAAGISGEFEIPTNTILASAVYSIQLSTEPNMPALVECELEVLNNRSKGMRFGFASNGPPYRFDLYTGDFTSRELHGRIRIPKTPLLVAGFHSQSSGMLRTKYFARVFSQRERPTLWKLIVVTVPRLLAFEQIVTELYPPTAKRKELLNFYFEFDTNKAEITLVPEDSISSESTMEENWTQKSSKIVKKQCPLTTPRETFTRTAPVCQARLSQKCGTEAKGCWKILPLKLNKISQQDIDRFHSTSYLLPTFEFIIILYSVESDKLQQLEHKFILIGAKPPENFFRIYLDPNSDGCHIILTKQELLRELASIDDWETLCENLLVPDAVLSRLRSTTLPREMKKKRCLEAYLDTGNACWEHLVKVVADYPFYNKALSRKIATQHGLDYL